MSDLSLHCLYKKDARLTLMLPNQDDCSGEVGRVLDLASETQPRHYVLSLSKTLYNILCLVLVRPRKTGKTQKTADKDVKHQRIAQ